MTQAGVLLKEASRRISRSDARIVLAHLAGTTREALIMHPEMPVTADVEAAFEAAVDKIARGCPVAYVTHRREFWSRPFFVSPAVLVPRPETETLVEEALAAIDARGCQTVADLGTGSGIVAVTIALEAPETRVTATDASPGALEVARINARKLGAQIEFLEGSWFAPLAGRRFDLIVSNPPYIASGDPHLANLAFEPQGALASGDDGLDDIRLIAAHAPEHLVRGGMLILEHGYDQGEAVREILRSSGFADIRTVRDLAQIERVSCARLA